RLRKRLRKAKNPNEERKRAIQNIVDMALEQFHEKLAKGEIEIKSTADLERLVKLSQLLDGEPTEIVKNEAEELAEIDIQEIDRKSTRLNSSHVKISYAVFCLKKKKLEHRP